MFRNLVIGKILLIFFASLVFTHNNSKKEWFYINLIYLTQIKYSCLQNASRAPYLSRN
jgi:hypothetical protein